ncbi:MAG TPA: hypothetical protein VMZ29_05660 [Candidatus Bathyarchaeia archaeon]|nr:hypothetical protein [Candidatus Bathyarchaeia archaeon]
MNNGESKSPLEAILQEDLTQNNAARIKKLEESLINAHKRLDVQHNTINVLARKIKEQENKR